jgi:hypothetical protein
MVTLIGKGRGSKVWHVVREPYSNEGVDLDRETHTMSLCSMVWTISETRRGEPTCKLCIKQQKLISEEIPDRACFMSKEKWARHRAKQAAAILELPFAPPSSNSGLLLAQPDSGLPVAARHHISKFDDPTGSIRNQ